MNSKVWGVALSLVTCVTASSSDKDLLQAARNTNIRICRDLSQAWQDVKRSKEDVKRLEAQLAVYGAALLHHQQALKASQQVAKDLEIENIHLKKECESLQRKYTILGADYECLEGCVFSPDQIKEIWEKEKTKHKHKRRRRGKGGKRLSYPAQSSSSQGNGLEDDVFLGSSTSRQSFRVDSLTGDQVAEENDGDDLLRAIKEATL